MNPKKYIIVFFSILFSLSLLGSSGNFGEVAWPASNLLTQLDQWEADEVTPDGIYCNPATDITFASNKVMPAFTCALSDNSTYTFHYQMPNSWNGGAVYVEASYIQVATDGLSALELDVSAHCCSSGDLVDASYGTPAELNIDPVSGDGDIDMARSDAITPSGTCAPGDHLFVLVEMDSGSTDTPVASEYFINVALLATVSGSDD